MVQGDLEGDFWKDIFVHMQHRNMVRTNVTKLTLENANDAFEAFAQEFPNQNVKIVHSSSYITWETYITPTVKLRLFIQNQIKGTLLKEEKGEAVKIADAKFPYNPFEEIYELIKNQKNYELSLKQKKNDALYANMQLKVAGEFAKALIAKKIEKNSSCKNAVWTVEVEEGGLLLEIKNEETEKKYNLSVQNLLLDLSKIFN